MSESNLHGERLLAMSVHNIGFLLDRLGQDCHPLQFLRELTQNGIETIERTGEPGTIVWDVDWNTYELEGTFKLCVTDTGDGMTGEELVKFINQLSSSVAEQSFSGNYGVGAKIATATRNRFGVIYLSWKNGNGSMIHLCRDSISGQYGLRQWKRADGSYSHFLPIENDVKPDLIKDHGTVVILLGNEDKENTLEPPPGSASPSRWISKYINTRYFCFPELINIRAREGWSYSRTDHDRNYLRTLTGQKAYLDAHAEKSGIMDMIACKVHWWILRDEPAIGNNSGFVESAGHIAALYQNELYELTTGRAGMARLQEFGVTFGYRWVVLYFEPGVSVQQALTTNTSRTALLVDSQPLPWVEWAAEFREKMPRELREFVEEKAAKSVSSDHTKSIRDRLKEIMELFKISRYRPSPGGSIHLDLDRLVRSGPDIPKTRSKEGVSSPSGKDSSTAGNIYAVFEKKNGIPGAVVCPDLFPTVRWISVSDGTRDPDDIEDRSARYLADQNLLLINADFRVFVDMQKYFEKEIGDKPGGQDLIREVVRGWFEQALVETVIGVQALQNSREWTHQDIEHALSVEALTAAVMQRYHIHFAVKRELGSKLGSLKGIGPYDKTIGGNIPIQVS